MNGQRIIEIDNVNFGEALRYLDIHNIDISNLDIYDLMINTDSFDPESITKIILTTLKVI